MPLPVDNPEIEVFCPVCEGEGCSLCEEMHDILHGLEDAIADWATSRQGEIAE